MYQFTITSFILKQMSCLLVHNMLCHSCLHLSFILLCEFIILELLFELNIFVFCPTGTQKDMKDQIHMAPHVVVVGK